MFLSHIASYLIYQGHCEMAMKFYNCVLTSHKSLKIELVKKKYLNKYTINDAFMILYTHKELISSESKK